MIDPSRLNRFASLAILPLIGVAFWFALRAQNGGSLDLSGEGTLVVANLRGDSLTFHDFDTAASATALLPGAPHELLLLDGALYVTLGRDDAVVIIDANSALVTRVLPLPGHPHGLAAEGASLFVSLDDADQVVEFTVPALAEAGRLATGDTPHVVISDEGRLVVTDSRDNRVHQISPGEASAPAGDTPESLAIIGRYLATADAGSGTVSLFDRNTLVQVTSIAVGPRPVRVVAYDDSTLLVAVGGSGELVVLDLAGMTVARRVTVGVMPDGICVSPSGKYVAVVANGDETVSIVGTSDWRVRATYAAPGGPGACLWAAGD